MTSYLRLFLVFRRDHEINFWWHQYTWEIHFTVALAGLCFSSICQKKGLSILIPWKTDSTKLVLHLRYNISSRNNKLREIRTMIRDICASFLAVQSNYVHLNVSFSIVFESQSWIFNWVIDKLLTHNIIFSVQEQKLPEYVVGQHKSFFVSLCSK